MLITCWLAAAKNCTLLKINVGPSAACRAAKKSALYQKQHLEKVTCWS